MKDTPSRKSRWAQTKRRELMFILGDHCAHCGLADNLTFDCIRPVNEGHHQMSSAARMTFYTRQTRAGNVQILCAACNVKKSNRKNGKYIPSTLPPFPVLPMTAADCDELECHGDTRLRAEEEFRKDH